MRNATKIGVVLAGLSVLAAPAGAIPMDVGVVANAVCSYGMAHADAVGLWATASASAGAPVPTPPSSGVGAAQDTEFGPGPTWSAAATSFYGLGTLSASCSLSIPPVPDPDVDACRALSKGTALDVKPNVLDVGTVTYSGRLVQHLQSGAVSFQGTKSVDGVASPFSTTAKQGTIAFTSDAVSEDAVAGEWTRCPELTVTFAASQDGGRSGLLESDAWATPA